MNGDGQTKYDLGNDGEANQVAACTAHVRGAKVATKMRVTVIKDEYIDVQLQYQACASLVCRQHIP